MSDPLPVESATEQPRSRTSVWNRNFAGLVITQFAGATNDNILKTVLLLQFARGQKWFDTLGEGGTGIISLMLTVPFVLLLGFAGQLAELDKRGPLRVLEKQFLRRWEQVANAWVGMHASDDIELFHTKLSGSIRLSGFG